MRIAHKTRRQVAKHAAMKRSIHDPWLLSTQSSFVAEGLKRYTHCDCFWEKIDHMQYHNASLFSSLPVQGYPSGAHHTTDGSFGGNRPRLDSGTSASSESSKGTGKPPRRRSHRPRGCRGGSNRRRNKAGELSRESKVSNLDGRDVPDSKIILVKHSMTKKCPSFENGATAKNVGDMHDLVHKRNYRERSLSSSSVSTAPTTDFSSSHDVDDISFLNDFSLIQPSFSNSSSEKGFDLVGYRGTSNQILPPLPSRNLPVQHIHSGRNPYALQNTKDASYPSISKCHDLSRALNGLTSSYATTVQSVNQRHISNHYYGYPMPLEDTGGNHFSAGVTVNSKSSAGSMDPPPPRHVLRMPVLSNMTVSTGIGRSIAPVCVRETGHHQAGRLEIQRQAVEGGSLFLTSPRSFLMGKRNFTSKTVSAP